MFFANRKGMQLRKAIVFGCSIGLLLTAFGGCALAGDTTTSYTPIGQGSSLTSRSEDDGWVGQVYIYVGGSLPTGTNLLEFRFLFEKRAKETPRGTSRRFCSNIILWKCTISIPSLASVKASRSSSIRLHKRFRSM